MPLQSAHLRRGRGGRRAHRLGAGRLRGGWLSPPDRRPEAEAAREAEALLERGRALLLTGDAVGLGRLLDRRPDLVRRRFTRDAPPYDGYFHGATLLHHVAGNPFMSALPPNLVEVATLLLDREAEVDAVTLQGPSQPDDIGWTTLGLVATSSEARQADVQEELMDLLMDAGADVDARNGGCLMGALYYGETSAAELLARRGARLDLVSAAGVGDTGALRRFLSAEARPGARDGGEGSARGSEADGIREKEEDRIRLAHYSRVPWPADAGYADLLALALVYAALHGRAEALRLLLDAGADPDHRPPFDHGGVALHWAVMGDRADSVRLLLEAGASPDLRDREHGATPAEWARHLGRPAAADALEGR